jgi:hypothetical protein
MYLVGSLLSADAAPVSCFGVAGPEHSQNRLVDGYWNSHVSLAASAASFAALLLLDERISRVQVLHTNIFCDPDRNLGSSGLVQPASAPSHHWC